MSESIGTQPYAARQSTDPTPTQPDGPVAAQPEPAAEPAVSVEPEGNLSAAPPNTPTANKNSGRRDESASSRLATRLRTPATKAVPATTAVVERQAASPTAPAEQKKQAVVATTESSAATPEISTVATKAAPSAVTTASVAAVAAPTPARLDVASEILRLVGLQSDPGAPTIPVESPALLAALAWVRRQSQPTLADQTDPAAATFAVAARAAANAAPVVTAPTVNAPNAQTGVVTGKVNATDVDSPTLTYTVKAAPSSGQLVFNANGTFSYTPTQLARLQAGASLTPISDGFTVSVSDGVNSTTQVVSVPVYGGQMSTATGTIATGASPISVAASGGRIYVLNSGSGTVTAIDAGTSGVIATVPISGQPTAMALSPDGQVLYVTDAGGTVRGMSTVSGAIVGTVNVGKLPQGVVVDPTGTKLYVANTGSNTVTVVNTVNGSTSTINVGSQPVAVAISPDGAKVYVVNRASGTVSVINAATKTVTSTISVGTMPQAIAVSADGSRMYVTNSGSNNVSVINTATRATVATVAVAGQPFGITLSRDGTLAYVVNGNSTLSVINLKTNTKVTGTLTVPTAPGSAAAVGLDGKLYITNSGGASVQTVSLVHVDPPPANPSAPQQAFTENFNGVAGTIADPALFNYHLGAGGTGGQQNAYTDWPSNASLDGDGHLVITARSEQVNVPGYGTFNYTSAWLTTEDKFEFTYGTVSARIKFPEGQGLHPAFWTLGSDTETVGWPQGGEIDIMELANSASFAGSSIHGPGGTSLSVGAPVDTSGFHDYWMRKEPGKITVGVDNQTIAVFTPDSLPPGAAWTYDDRSMYVILNLAVGNPWGSADPTTPLVAEMVVDSLSYTPL